MSRLPGWSGLSRRFVCFVDLVDFVGLVDLTYLVDLNCKGGRSYVMKLRQIFPYNFVLWWGSGLDF